MYEKSICRFYLISPGRQDSDFHVEKFLEQYKYKHTFVLLYGGIT